MTLLPGLVLALTAILVALTYFLGFPIAVLVMLGIGCPAAVADRAAAGPAAGPVTGAVEFRHGGARHHRDRQLGYRRPKASLELEEIWRRR